MMNQTPMLISISLFSYLSFLRRAIFYAFFYVYLRTFLGLSNTLSALLGTANLFTSIIGQLKIWGPRLDYNPNLAKRFVVRGEVIAGFVYLFAFFGHRIVITIHGNFLAAIFLISCTSFLEIFWSGSDLGIRHLTAEITKGTTRGRLVGTIDGLGLFGQLIGFLIGGTLFRSGMGFYQGTIFYVVVFFIFSCAVVIFITPYKEKIRDTQPSFDLTSSSLQKTLRVPKFGFFIGILIILIMGLYSSHQIFFYYVTDNSALNFSDQLLSYLLILFTLSGGILSPIGGKISDKVGRINIILISSISASLSYFLFFILGEQSFMIIALIYIVLGGSSALIQSNSFAFSADILPDKTQGSGFGIYNISLATGWGLAGFLIGGPISDLLIFLGESNSIAYRFSFLVSSLVMLLGTSLLFYFNFKQNR